MVLSTPDHRPRSATKHPDTRSNTASNMQFVVHWCIYCHDRSSSYVQRLGDLMHCSSSVLAKVFQVLLFLNTVQSFAKADSFPHCAANDAKCVGEVLLDQIRWGGGSGGGPSTFCTCEAPNSTSYSDYCRIGNNYYSFKALKLKRIADGSEISELSVFRTCSSAGPVTPESACDAALTTNPACRR